MAPKALSSGVILYQSFSIFFGITKKFLVLPKCVENSRRTAPILGERMQPSPECPVHPSSRLSRCKVLVLRK